MFYKASSKIVQRMAASSRPSGVQRVAAAASSHIVSSPSMSIMTPVRPRGVKGAIVTSQRRQFSSLPDHMVIEMPNLSPTMEKGNLKTWNKKVGEAVAPGDVLASIETDKAVVDFEMQEEGFVAKLLFEEGAQDVPLGTAVAILVEDEADVAAFANYTPGSEAPA
jgi:biotin carboxyl carrier protein